MSTSNGHQPPAPAPPPDGDWQPARAGRFSRVVATIHKDGPAAGFRQARDLMFQNYEVLKRQISPYMVLKLAIELDRHALYCDLVAAKNRGAQDESLWQQYQEYLQGGVDVAPSSGVPAPVRLAAGDGVEVTADVEPDDDESDPEETPDAD